MRQAQQVQSRGGQELSDGPSRCPPSVGKNLGSWSSQGVTARGTVPQPEVPSLTDRSGYWALLDQQGAGAAGQGRQEPPSEEQVGEAPKGVHSFPDRGSPPSFTWQDKVGTPSQCPRPGPNHQGAPTPGKSVLAVGQQPLLAGDSNVADTARMRPSVNTEMEGGRVRRSGS